MDKKNYCELFVKCCFLYVTTIYLFVWVWLVSWLSAVYNELMPCKPLSQFDNASRTLWRQCLRHWGCPQVLAWFWPVRWLNSCMYIASEPHVALHAITKHDCIDTYCICLWKSSETITNMNNNSNNEHFAILTAYKKFMPPCKCDQEHNNNIKQLTDNREM